MIKIDPTAKEETKLFKGEINFDNDYEFEVLRTIRTSDNAEKNSGASKCSYSVVSVKVKGAEVEPPIDPNFRERLISAIVKHCEKNGIGEKTS